MRQNNTPSRIHAVDQQPLWIGQGKSGFTESASVRPNPVGSTSNFSKLLSKTHSATVSNHNYMGMI